LKKVFKFKILSYMLSNKEKGYGNAGVLSIMPDKQLSKGDSCNTSILHLSSHAGTHIDFPKHFFDSGKGSLDYDIGNLIYTKPLFISCVKKENELILPEDILYYDKRLKRCDILFLRTGFFKLRKSRKYYMNNPGIAPETARLIRQRYPTIRCIGIDTISVSPYKKRELGRETHRIFLENKSPVLLIEDMDLSASLRSLQQLQQIIVLPLRIKGIEASPCNVLGSIFRKSA